MAERLLTGSVQGAVVIALVWLACRRLTWMPASVQATLWWLAALKMVVALLPLPAVSLPLLPAPDLPPADLAVLDLVARPAESATIGSWLALLVFIWVAILLAQSARLVVAFRQMQGVIRRSVPLPDEGAAVDRTRSRLRSPLACVVRWSSCPRRWRPVICRWRSPTS
jgi:hypothetical protein